MKAKFKIVTVLQNVFLQKGSSIHNNKGVIKCIHTHSHKHADIKKYKKKQLTTFLL